MSVFTSTTLAALVVLVAIPGLLSRRGGPMLVRVCALLALLGLGVGVLNLKTTSIQQLPVRLAVVPTSVPTKADPDLTVPQRLHQLAGEAGEVRVFGDRDFEDLGPLEARLLAARLAFVEEPELVILWNGPWQPGASGSVDAGPLAHAVVPRERPPVDPEGVRVRLSAPWAVGRPCKLLVEVGPAPPDLWFEVRIRRQDQDVGRQTIAEATRPTPAAPFQVQFQPTLAGTHLLELKIQSGGYTLTGSGQIPVGRPPKVNVVGFAAPSLARALAVQGLVAVPHDHVPADLGDVVVLLDAVDMDAQRRLLQFVDDGGGVLVVGASDGGAVPGATEPLHMILPVRRLVELAKPAKGDDDKGDSKDTETPPDRKPDRPRKPPDKPPDRPTGKLPPTKAPDRPEVKEVDRRSIAMVFLIDRSNSMSTVVTTGRTRMDFAKRAAVDAAKLLKPGDQVGVVSFGNRGKGRVVVPLTGVARWRDIQKAVSGLTHEFEETYAADALEKAMALLKRSGAPVKHVVVITDGEIMDTTATGEFRALKAAQRARRAGCTVSVVQVVPVDQPEGSEMVRSEPAQKLSKAGGGILARPRTAKVIPVVVSTEVRRTMERAEHGPNKEPPEPPTKKPDPKPKPQPPKPPKRNRMKVRAVSDSPLLEPTPDAGYPDLFGILPVRGRADAQVLLVAGAEGVPLLAFANRGLGRIGVWTADLLGGWGREWRQAEAFPAWLAQWVQHLAPPLPASPPEVLQELQLSPPAPLPQEVAALLDLTDGRVCELSEYPQPEPRHRDQVFGLAPDHALFGLLALLILLLTEFLQRATGMRRKITTGP